MKYLIVFMVYFVLDWLWVVYMKAAEKNRAVLAGLSAMMLYLGGVLGTLSVFDEHSLIWSILAGSFLGTYAVVRFTGRSSTKTEVK